MDSYLELNDTFLPAAFLQLFGDPATNPVGFPMMTVGTMFSKRRIGAKCGPFGSALKNHEYVAQGIPVWTMDNVGRNEFREEGCLYITPVKFDELEAYDATNGDILISRAGTVGRMAIVRTRHPRSIIHTNIIRLSLDSARCLPVYFTVLMTFFAAQGWPLEERARRRLHIHEHRPLGGPSDSRPSLFPTAAVRLPSGAPRAFASGAARGVAPS